MLVGQYDSIAIRMEYARYHCPCGGSRFQTNMNYLMERDLMQIRMQVRFGAQSLTLKLVCLLNKRVWVNFVVIWKESLI